MKTTNGYRNELSILTAAIADHADRINCARYAADMAAEAFESFFGYHPAETPELAPGYAGARMRAEALDEETGYFWACSRKRDLETILGVGTATGQRRLVIESKHAWADCEVIGIGGMPHADPSVAVWIAEHVFGRTDAAAVYAVVSAAA